MKHITISERSMQQILVIGLGGFAGAIARYVLSGAMQRRFPGFTPAGTLLVNVLGCLAIGFLMGLVIERQSGALTSGPLAMLGSERARALLVTGFLGSLTTFSALGYETVELLRENAIGLAMLNVAANLCLGVPAVWVGLVMAGAAVR